MRADRLLSMIWLLRAHGRMSTAQLAQRLEVSRRTVLRDVEALSAAGVPVYCERGPRGGVRLLPGYRTDVTALSQEESRALFAAISEWGAQSIGLGEALASGVRKLLAAVPEAHREQAAQIASRIVIDPQGWLPQPEAERITGAFAVVQYAVFERHRLRLSYRARRRARSRELEVAPHGLVSAGSDWYLCAADKERIRFLKASRIENAVVLDESCRGAEVDVAKVWREQRAAFLAGFTPVVVEGWLRSERWEEAREQAMRAVAAQEPEMVGEAPGAGWRPIRLEFMDRLHAVAVLMRLGAAIRIDSPPEIRAELLEHIERIASLYRR